MMIPKTLAAHGGACTKNIYRGFLNRDNEDYDTTCWGNNLVLCELMNSTITFNQSPRYQSHTRDKDLCVWRALFP